MKFMVKVMLVAYDELIDTREHEITADNQVAAIRKALEAEGWIELQPCETLVVFAIPHEHKIEEKPGGMDFTGFPHPKRDDRDPYGRIERQMLSDRCGSDERTAREDYRQKHPEFAAEYGRTPAQNLAEQLTYSLAKQRCAKNKRWPAKHRKKGGPPMRAKAHFQPRARSLEI